MPSVIPTMIPTTEPTQINTQMSTRETNIPTGEDNVVSTQTGKIISTNTVTNTDSYVLFVVLVNQLTN